jgi:hypothetical protein
VGAGRRPPAAPIREMGAKQSRGESAAPPRPLAPAEHDELLQRLAEAEAQLTSLQQASLAQAEQQPTVADDLDTLAMRAMAAEESCKAIEQIVALLDKGAAPPRFHPEISIRLVLVDQGSPRRCIFDDLGVLQSGAATTLTLRSHRGLGIGKQYAEERRAGPWRYTEATAACAQAQAITVQWVDQKFLMLCDADLCFDVSHWKMEAGNTVNFVGGSGRHKTRQGGGGRDWVLNGDGTIAAKHRHNLVLGLDRDPPPIIEGGVGATQVSTAAEAAAASAAAAGVSTPPVTSSAELSQGTLPADYASTMARALAVEAAAGRLYAQRLEVERIRPELEELKRNLATVEETVACLPVRGSQGVGTALDMDTAVAKHKAIRSRGTDLRTVSTTDAAKAEAALATAAGCLKQATRLESMVRGEDLTLARAVLSCPSWKQLQAELHATWELAASHTNSGGSGAYLTDVVGMDDNDVLLHWTQAHSILPEYEQAASMICVEREWMADTMLLRHIRNVTIAHGDEIDAIRKDSSAFEKVLQQAIEKAYGVKGAKACKRQKDVLSGQNIFSKVQQVYNTLEGWKKPYFVHGWRIILRHENDVGAIVSKLSEVVDHSMHCPHVQVKSFQLVLSHCSRLVVSNAVAPPEGDPVHPASDTVSAIDDPDEWQIVQPLRAELPAPDAGIEDLQRTFSGTRIVAPQGPSTLVEKVEVLRTQLDLGDKGPPLVDMVNRAMQKLGIAQELEGQIMVQKVDACLQLLGEGAVVGSTQPADRVSVGVAVEASLAVDADVAEDAIARASGSNLSEYLTRCSSGERAITLALEQPQPATGPDERIDPDVAQAASQKAYEAALRRFYDCFEDFLDDHKEHAFSASFMEPARCYLATGGFAHWLADNVDTHSNNWHIALLNAALGVHVPLLGNYWDDFPPPVVDFWAGLKPQAWDFFRDPAHFGNGWRGIPGLQKQSKKLVARKVETGRLPISAGGMGKRGSCLGQSLDVRVRRFHRNVWTSGWVD